ncbi:MAG: single-stranded DNA-binding protein [Acidiferrobacteraceae bacterium]|nr:single-stranded DNA-binding protein [Acidiferrobacteraceae bacterium]|tara:strand:- start:136 stop:576 length:441 start_codon:yes stop_codon:yes gene_type:complete
MARGVNKVILVGNLGADPEVRYTANGDAVSTISVATNRSYKRKDSDEWTQETEWHRVVVFGRSAEAISQYLTKGREVYVEGRLRTNKYEDKDGIERWSTEIVANDVQFLGGRGDESGANFGEPPIKASKASNPKGQDSDLDDDIPF